MGYDSVGNRLSDTVSGATTTYSYPSTSHGLTAVAGRALQYDPNGNTVRATAIRDRNGCSARERANTLAAGFHCDVLLTFLIERNPIDDCSKNHRGHDSLERWLVIKTSR